MPEDFRSYRGDAPRLPREVLTVNHDYSPETPLHLATGRDVVEEWSRRGIAAVLTVTYYGADRRVIDPPDGTANVFATGDLGDPAAAALHLAYYSTVSVQALPDERQRHFGRALEMARDYCQELIRAMAAAAKEDGTSENT